MKQIEEKEDMFDMKEFLYCRKMLSLKNHYGNGNNIFDPKDHIEFVSILQTERQVNTEAHLI